MSKPEGLTLPLRADELLIEVNVKLSELRYTKRMGAQMWGERVNVVDDELLLFENLAAYLVSCVNQMQNEGDLFRRLSDALTGGNASTWDEVIHAASSVNQMQETEGDPTGVDTLSSAIQPAGSTAASNEAVPAKHRSPSLRAREGWRPIAEAPKDGTVIIGYDPDKDDDDGLPHGVDFMRWHEGRWIDPLTHGVSPTHFQPLPDPPSPQ